MAVSEGQAGDKQRIGQLDGVRTIAIAMVFLNHAFRVKLAWAGVDLFFILSGFLITGILIASKGRTIGDFFGHFYSRRVRRILPPYFLLLVLMTVFAGVGWLRHWYLYLFLMNLLGPLGIAHPGAASILWSLAVEEQFYLFWPFVVFFLSERAITWTAAGLVVAAPLLRYFATPYLQSYVPVYTLTPFRMDLMALGALFAVAWRHRRGVIERVGAYGLVLTAVAIGMMLWLSRKPDFTILGNTPFANLWIYELTLVGSAGVVLWALSGRGVGVLKLGVVRYVGRISYSFYLVHVLTLGLVQNYVRNEWLVASIALASSLAYAAACWRWLEQPILFAGRGSKVRREALVDEQAISRQA